MELEKAHYSITWYHHLLTIEEMEALKHHRHSLTIRGMSDNKLRSKLYKKINWLTDNPDILRLLDNGYNSFISDCAERVLADNPGMDTLNVCPKCGKLARTPWAKQCRYCVFDWH